jgi:tetratricopeptide (TPR) repeat protein
MQSATRSSSACGLNLLLTAIVILRCLAATPLAAGEEPKKADGRGAVYDLAAGMEVVLKSPTLFPLDLAAGRAGGDDLVYVVERSESGRLLLASRDRQTRGWLLCERVVPFAEAAEYFAGVLRNEPRDVEAHWMRARLLACRDDLHGAIAHLGMAIRRAPDQPRLYITRGLVHYRLGRFDDSIADCDKAAELDPGATQAYVIRAIARIGKNDVAAARTDLEQVLKFDGTIGPERRRGELVATVAFVSQDAAARDADQGASGKTEGLTPAELVARGKDHYASQDYNQAIADFDEAIRIDRKYAPAYVARGRAWARKHYRERELADCSEAIRLDPNNAALRVARGESWSAQGRHVAALADYDEALRLEPANPSNWVARGNEWRRDLKLDQAIADYTQAVQIDPKYIPAYIERGNTHKQRRAFDRAIQEFTQLTQLDPQNALVHMTLARMLATANEPQYRNGKWALDEANRACELTRWQDPDCLDTLAAACAEVGDFSSAVKWETVAIKQVRQKVPSLLQQKAISFGGGRGVGFDDRLSFYKSKKPTRE